MNPISRHLFQRDVLGKGNPMLLIASLLISLAIVSFEAVVVSRATPTAA